MKNHLTISQWGIGIIAMLLTIISSNLNWGKKDYWQGIIESDGRGYYAYLPATFIYQDFSFSFFESMDRAKYFDEKTFYDYRTSYKGKTLNKYYCGTALVLAPFFGAAHITSILTGEDLDGYSKWYQISVNIGAIFWLLIGIIYLDKTLLLYDISVWNRLIVLVATVFGTHAFYYTLVEPAMSHIYSFAFVSLFIYLAKLFINRRSSKDLIFCSIVLAIIILIRPINGIILVLLPFLAGDLFNLQSTIAAILKKPATLLFGLIIFSSIISIQFIFYKLSVGKFFVYAYGNEGFDFSNPHIFEILFSYKKGLFLYTPMLFISLFGLIFLWQKSKFETVTWLFFFVCITYILSSWWMWYYGGSFSSRVYLEFVPIFMILLAILLRDVPFGWKESSLKFVIFLLIVVCQIQTYQYRYYQIHWSDMTKDKYWEVFLRLDKI